VVFTATCCRTCLLRDDEEGEGNGLEFDEVVVAFVRTRGLGGGIISGDGVVATAMDGTDVLALLTRLAGGQLEPVLRVFRKGPSMYLGGFLRGEDDGGWETGGERAGGLETNGSSLTILLRGTNRGLGFERGFAVLLVGSEVPLVWAVLLTVPAIAGGAFSLSCNFR
jgi:hypothetical protein